MVTYTGAEAGFPLYDIPTVPPSATEAGQENVVDAIEDLAEDISVANDLIPIVPSNADPLPVPARAIRCKPTTGTAGTIKFMSLSGQERTTEINKGETINVGVTKVFATGTTATGLEELT